MFHGLQSHVVADLYQLLADLLNPRAEHPHPQKKEINVDCALKIDPIARADQDHVLRGLLDHTPAEDQLPNTEVDILEAAHQNLDHVAPAPALALALEVTVVRVTVKMNVGDSLQWQTEKDFGKCIEAGKNKSSLKGLHQRK